MGYERLPWDSEFFGLPIGRIQPSCDPDALQDAVSQADAAGIRCLYQLVGAEQLGVLHQSLSQGFVPYDIRVELERPLETTEPANGEAVPIRRAGAGDEAALARLATATISHTRFSLDPHFPRDRVTQLYPAWIRRGLAEAGNRAVLIAGRDAGFVVCGFDPRAAVGTIELIAVAPAFAGRRLGRALMAHAHAAMAQTGCRSARVVTQGRNLAAQRLYQAMGYRTRGMAWWLHRWR